MQPPTDDAADLEEGPLRTVSILIPARILDRLDRIREQRDPRPTRASLIREFLVDGVRRENVLQD